jgi:hypothetical protein
MVIPMGTSNASEISKRHARRNNPARHVKETYGHSLCQR